ncbi:MAG: hypothetical protein AAGD38_08470 [Acidobacteriota bacterium]
MIVDLMMWGGLGTLGLVGLGGIGTGALSLLADLGFRRHDYASKYYRDYQKKLRERARDMAAYLEPELRRLDCDRGADQVLRLVTLFETFREIVRDKFRKDDVTYDRFSGTAEAFFVASLGKLQNVLSQLRIVASIDPEYVQRYEGDDEVDLSERLNVRQAAETQIRESLADIDRAINGFTVLSGQIAGVNDFIQQDDFEDLMVDMGALASTAHLLVNENELTAVSGL